MTKTAVYPLIDALLTLVPIKANPDVRALEISPGIRAGKTTAALADRLGGSVVSISRSAQWVATARAAHAGDCRLTFHRQRSLADGYAVGETYNLVPCWKVMDHVPRAWLAQCVPGGWALCPMFLDELATVGIVRMMVDENMIPQSPTVALAKAGREVMEAVEWEVRAARLNKARSSWSVSWDYSTARLWHEGRELQLPAKP
jgi:protein-L-isoaspartate O-methyltransferase